ncbi:ABC transporter substrate-binding protein [Promicromonospora sp. Populi]|uniref:ABC transporter substrate-binding protein n=1 Tax=Promicromonospora sp. Populi TaxID=3239420 RepID=UPI0034E1EAA0
MIHNRSVRTRTRAAAATAVVALAALVAGCSGSSGEEDNGRFVVFSPQQTGSDLATNAYTEQVAEELDLDFEWQTTTYDSAAAAENRQVSLVGGDYPDAYLLIDWVDAFTRAELLRYGQQGVALPLNDLIAEHAPNITAAMEAEPEWAEALYAPDGNIYGISRWDECYHCSYPAKLWMNSTWLDELGLEQPTTTDEFRDVLRAFKNDDPNGNGEADEVPLSGSVDTSIIPYIMNAFTYAPIGGDGSPGPLALNGDQVVMQAVTDEWREGLEFINSLFDEDLVDAAAFSQNAEALLSLGNSSNGVVLGAGPGLHPGVIVTIDQEDGRDRQYDAVPPLTGPEGWSTTSGNSSVNPLSMFVLTNRATEEEQVKAIQMMDALYTDEGRLAAQWGPEGVAWEPASGDDEALDPELEPSFEALPYEDTQNLAWRSLAQYYNPAEFRNAQVVATDSYTLAGYERRLFDATEQYAPFAPEEDTVFPYYSLWPDLETSAELAEVQTNITSYITQANAEFATGQRDVTDDAEWDAYLSDLDGLGLARYLELWQELYDAA